MRRKNRETKTEGNERNEKGRGKMKEWRGKGNWEEKREGRKRNREVLIVCFQPYHFEV